MWLIGWMCGSVGRGESLIAIGGVWLRSKDSKLSPGREAEVGRVENCRECSAAALGPGRRQAGGKPLAMGW